MSWHDQAACRGLTGLFFPERGENAHREARRLCAGCPVSAECADAGRHEAYGIWAGSTPRQRARAARGWPPRVLVAKGYTDPVVSTAVGVPVHTIRSWRRQMGVRKDPWGRVVA